MQKLFALAGAVAVLTIGSASARAVGPSFDCASAHTAGAQVICSNPDLSRTELSRMQAYYALRWQEGQPGRASLRQEDLAFQSQTLQQCGVPKSSELPADTAAMAACMQQAYQRQRDHWASRLTGLAAEEAARPLDEHVALQRALQSSGFLPSTQTIDGVYGTTTRTAISAWQHANGRPETGFLSHADSTTLLPGQQPAPATTTAAAPVTLPPIALPAAAIGHAGSLHLDGGSQSGAPASGLSELEDMLAQYWQSTGGNGIAMALGFLLVAAGCGAMFRAPRRIGDRATNHNKFSEGAQAYARLAGSRMRHGPALMVSGGVVALYGACATYGATGIYEMFRDTLTRMLA